VKKLLLALSLAVSLAVTASLAVPIIQVTVQQLGAGYSDVLSPVGKAWVNHVFAIDNGKVVLDKVKVKFDKDLPKGTYIRVELRDSNDNVLASGETTLTQDLPKGTHITIDLQPNLDVYGIIKYSRIVVVVAGAEVGT